MKIRNEAGCNLAHFLAAIDDISLFKIIMELHPSLSEEDDSKGLTAIDFAIFYEAQKILELLLQESPDALGRKGKEGVTPLHNACANNLIGSVALLLSRLKVTHPNIVSVVDDNGNTIFHAACAQGARKVVELLLKECPDLIAQQNKEGSTALHLACLNNQIEVMDFLLSRLNVIHPNIVSQVDYIGNTILHLACDKGVHKVVQLLLKECPDLINMKGEDGLTPLDIAFKKKHLNVARVLLNKIKLDSEKTLNDFTSMKCTPLMQTINITFPNWFFQSTINDLETFIDRLLYDYKMELLQTEEDINTLVNSLNSMQPCRLKTSLIRLFIKHGIIDPTTQPVDALEMKSELSTFTLLKSNITGIIESNNIERLRFIQKDMLMKKNDGPLCRLYSPAQMTEVLKRKIQMNSENIIDLVKRVSQEFDLKRLMDAYGNNLMHLAVQASNLELVGLLLTLQPELALMCNDSSNTPIDLAVDGKFQILELLVKLAKSITEESSTNH